MRNLINELSVRKDSNFAGEELVDIVDRCVTLDDIREYLSDQIVKSAPDVEGYVHQLGFHKYLICTIAGAKLRRIRLHFWRRCEISDDIHDHIASFASKVLWGDLEHETFKVSDVGEAFSHYRFMASGNGCSLVDLPEERQVRLQLASRATVAQARTYFVHHDDLHRAMPVSEYLISLMVQDEPIDRRINVFQQSAQFDDRPHFSRRLLPMETLNSFRQMAFLLGGGQ